MSPIKRNKKETCWNLYKVEIYNDYGNRVAMVTEDVVNDEIMEVVETQTKNPRRLKKISKVLSINTGRKPTRDMKNASRATIYVRAHA